MSEIVNKFLSAGNKFTPESAQGLITGNKKRIKKLNKQEIHDIFIKTN